MLLLLYTLTMFVSATLLFMVQPMFARMVLPLLGGSPSVWNTAQVFYQVALLLGYGYAHLSSSRLRPRRQVLLHGLLLLLPLLVLPIGVPGGWSPPTSTSPIGWLLALLAVAVGLPFLVVATSSPLLQSWFARSGHPAAADPYFLYAASNIGSMLALLGYPTVIEPALRLRDQSLVWSGGYILLLLLVLACGATVWRADRGRTTDDQRPTANDQRPTSLDEGRRAKDEAGAGASVDLSSAQERSTAPTLYRSAALPLQRLRWVLLALVPSSLMLSVTSYLSTNIAAIPLLWVIPLAIYLLTFILVFARRPLLPAWLMRRAMPIVLIPLLIAMLAQATSPLQILLPLHLLTFFVVTMVCHGALAAERPAPARLTEFYLLMSLGGALGGMFNALLAPLLFSSVAEYPLVLVLACLLMPPAGQRPTTNDQRGLTKDGGRRTEDEGPPASGEAGAGPAPSPGALFGRWSRADVLVPLALGLVTVGLVLGVQASGRLSGPPAYALMFGLPALVCFGFSRRPLRFGLGVAALLLASQLYVSDQGRQLYAERSFFGVHRVLLDPSGRFHVLAHGATLHGVQSLDPARAREPLAYYTAAGPIGQAFAAFSGPAERRRVAVVGLGVGSLACYKQPGQRWTYYEIDPAVERIARDPQLFSFLQQCDPQPQIVLGDARLTLQSSREQYDLLVLDAYSSDTIPMHLLTREALQLYQRRLAPGGVLAFHISNLYLDLKPVVGALAADAGLAALEQDDLALSAEDQATGRRPAQWVLLARSPADLGPLAASPRWQPLAAPPGAPVWTDDFSSIITALRR
jgi:SAM-dependent methyltransferase